MEKSEEQRNVITLSPSRNEVSRKPDVPALSEQVLPAAGAEQPVPGQWLGTNTSTLSAIERLKATIDKETEKLEIREPVDFDAFSQRKNRGLLELTRAMRLTQGVGLDPRVAPHLADLRASLVRNQAALQIHLDAVREVSAIIAKSIQEVESDGTYSLAGSSKSQMIKLLMTGVWACMVTVGASLGISYWQESRAALPPKQEYLEGLVYEKTKVINVPMIAEGSVQGYIVAQLVFTADAKSPSSTAGATRGLRRGRGIPKYLRRPEAGLQKSRPIRPRSVRADR